MRKRSNHFSGSPEWHALQVPGNVKVLKAATKEVKYHLQNKDCRSALSALTQAYWHSAVLEADVSHGESVGELVTRQIRDQAATLERVDRRFAKQCLRRTKRS